jgi:predicted dehydrogenase
MSQKHNSQALNRPASDLTRRDAVKVAGGAAAAVALTQAPWIQKVKAANNQVSYAVIGTGGRGQYHIKHFNTLDGGRCLAVCDIDDKALEAAKQLSKDKPQGYKDYREVLNRTDIEAVVIAVPLYMHFPVTRDALLAGKHVFCEKSLVFTAEEVHALRKLYAERSSKQVLQTGLQRRYSKFYQTARQMIEKGMLGKVTNVYAQWNRASLGKTWQPPSWRVFRKYSGGLTAELASHQIDIADWMIGSHPEFVTGVGGIDTYKDGRDVYDNIQLIFAYPGGQKLMYSSISTNKHLPLFGSTRTEFGEMIMGTEGTIHITVGTDNEPATALWFYEPGAPRPEAAKGKEKAAVANASLLGTGKGSRGLPVLFDDETVKDSDSFLQRELKFAKLWLYKKGVMVPEEDKNPVDVQLESFMECVRTGARPKADINVGLEDSINVLLANLAMDEGRRVFMNEIEKMGVGAPAVKKV